MQNDKIPTPIHDGKRVREILMQTDFSHKEFNRLMGWKARRIEVMLKREDWTTRELVGAGEILGYNFFLEYCAEGKSRQLQTVNVPLWVFADPKGMEQVQRGILDLADRIREIRLEMESLT